jgi:hypothetical protein
MSDVLKKIAQSKPDELEDAPGVVSTKPSAPPSGQRIHPTAVNRTEGQRSIQRMQEALIKIRSEFQNSELFAQSNTVDSDKTVDHPNTGGSFLTTLLNRHMASASTSTDFNQTKQQIGNGKPWGLINRLESLANVGTMVKDTKGTSVAAADGIWGPKTNTALSAVADIVDALASAGERTGLAGKTDISHEEAKIIRSEIPKDSKTDPKLLEKSEKITEALHKIEASASPFAKHLSAAYVGYEKDEQGLSAGFSASKKQEETNKIKSLPGVSNGGFMPVPKDSSQPQSGIINISFYSLSDINELTKFIQDNSIMVDGKSAILDKTLLNKYLDHLKSEIANNRIKPSINAVDTKEKSFTDPWSK